LKLKTLCVVILALSAGCVHKPIKPLATVSVMTFNVENLFDTEHDVGKEDFAFLPIAKKQKSAHKNFCAKIKVKKWKDECLYLDWNEAKLAAKLNRVAETILQQGAGQGPDIVILQEVENKKVLERLNKEHLGQRYREIVLIEGHDRRGIDVAIISKLPLIKEAKLHKIPFRFDDPAREADTRGILEAQFHLPDGKPVVVYALHLPNPMHPAELRTQALNYLNQISDVARKEAYVIAGGDFNITAEEDLKEKRTESLAKDWLVSHAVGCKGSPGTSYFPPKQSWSFLDWIMFSKNLSSDASDWKLDQSSVRVLTGYHRQLDEQGFPKSFEDPSKPLGVSDHLPISGVLVKSR
jgi:endonuclease/exonuclease/phosphatase family metal-dependent hydrolase